MAAASSVAAASRKHVELSLELKRKLIQEHEHGVPFTLLGKKYHIATSTAANIWRKKDFFLRSRMSGSRKRCNDRSKYKIVNQVTALFVKSMLERNHKIDGEVIKRFARTAAAQCNFKDFHGSNGWLDSFKKRENVCWVRRRGGVSDRNPAAMAASQAALMQQQQQHHHHNQQQPQLQPQQQRSDSPNLGAAAAAAAIAASAQQHQHQHRSGSPLGGSWMDDNEAQHTCARCNVAAAAAALAALNASDSIHERDHEIEDWFHGIPFLCQFFEEYQSMHLSDSSSSGSSGVSSGLGGSNTNQPSSSSASSSSVSSTQAAGPRNDSTPASDPSTSLQLQFQPEPPVRSLSDAHELALDPMDDCGSSASSVGQFRASASLADIQVAAVCAAGLQRNISIEMFVHDPTTGRMKEEPSSSSAPQTQQTQYEMQAYSNEKQQANESLQQQASASSDQLMEISFQHSSSGSQQQVAMMQSCGHKPECSDNVNLALEHSSQQLISKQDCPATISNNNNNNNQQSGDQQQQSEYAKVEDLEFYLPPSHARYIPQDAQSTDDILSYHDDQVSDHNDCCSDHYDQVSGLQLNAEYQQSASSCYMDEYEYENISTIRHYPVTATSMIQQQQQHHHQQQQQQPAQISTASCLQHFALSSGGELEPHGCLQQHQQQQVSCELTSCQSAGALSSRSQLMNEASFLTPSSPPSTASTAHRTTTGYLESSACKSANLAAINGAVESHLAEQELAVEHADHEEHNLLHNALMRSPEKLKLIDSIITLLNYASNYNHKMLAPLLDIKRCIERDLEVVLSDTSSENHRGSTSGASCCNEARQRQLMRRLLETPSQETQHQQSTAATCTQIQQPDTVKLQCNGNNHLDNNTAASASNNNHLEVSMDQRMQP